MANTSAIRGARVIGMVGGGPFNGSVRRYVIPSGDGTATFVGDFVKSGGTGVTIATGETYPTVIQAAAGDTIRGVVIGFDPIAGIAIGSENLNRLYRPASTQMVVWVCDDPKVLLEIQADGTTALIDVGENADIIVAAGSTATGMSGMQLNSTDHKTGSAQLRILGFINRPDNTPGIAYSKLMVMINEHELSSTTGV
jgi:hypothetical protein